uniref:Uncharacterized protein n=1 Tax=Quercus lobata TaxID=97700 RepID=A0A7N2L5P7_QUELO
MLKARHIAIENALVYALSQGMAAKVAAIKAQKEGAKSAKLATWKAKRIIGPIISYGWDFFEAIFYGGTMTEGFLRALGHHLACMLVVSLEGKEIALHETPAYEKFEASEDIAIYEAPPSVLHI